MTSTAQTSGAGPVDFVTFGDYGDFKPPKAQPAASSPAAKAGEFVRAAYRFQGRITADGSSGYRAEPGRYHLYISWACPWAHRSAIVRELLGLQDVISLSAVDPVRDGRGWAFRAGDGFGLDPVNGFALLREAYEASEPGYDGHVSVPLLWDRQTGRIVSNNFPDITIDLDTQFRQWADPAFDLYPEALRPQIDEISELIYATVNNGVYRSGFATTQESYHEAVTRLFATLDQLDERLAGQRYLLGDHADRGRRAAVGDAGQVRRGLLLALQVQPAADQRLPQPVGVRTGPVRAARLPRHHPLRSDQAALLHHAPAAEPVADRAGWPGT